MQDLGKIDNKLLFSLLKFFMIGLGAISVPLVLSRVLPFYFAPVLGLLVAMAMYTLLYNNRVTHSLACALIPYAVFYCLISYSLLIIVTNLLYISNVIELPKEMSFFDDPFLPTLFMDPVCFVTFLIIYLKNGRVSICQDCRIHKGPALERGKLGEILTSESRRQILNLTVLFGLMTVVDWVYFFLLYDRAALLNNRDIYIFIWFNLIAFALDIGYYGMRYYNIYLDLKDNGAIINEEEIEDMSAKTYLRFYVICGNHIYVNAKTMDYDRTDRDVIDSPFVIRRNVNGCTTEQVRQMAEMLTGNHKGELRFFFGRMLPDLINHRVMRYFYFLDGDDTDLPELPLNGEWMDFEMVKTIYATNPSMLAKVFLSDISRMTTVVLTQKLFNENGYRKIKAKSYQPTYNLPEVREHRYDFQDDKWIRIAMFNSDNKAYALRRWWRRHFDAIAQKLWDRER